MKFYSVKELIPEITGIDEKYDKRYESESRKVYRIDESIRSISSYHDTQGIPECNKDSYLKMMKAIYNDDEVQAIARNIKNKKNISDEQALRFFDFILDKIEDKELKKYLGRYRDELRSEELLKVTEDINKEIMIFMSENQDLAYESQIKTLEQLRDTVKETLNDYRKQINVIRDLNSYVYSEEGWIDMVSKIDKHINEYKMKK
ncbi:hypothetical protein [Romboutsia sp.]|uniref:hypothetical protein n=1 Tax=Romboutsia sp. TaxID=1965302 RepID=UPI003F31AD66